MTMTSTQAVARMRRVTAAPEQGDNADANEEYVVSMNYDSFNWLMFALKDLMRDLDEWTDEPGSDRIQWCFDNYKDAATTLAWLNGLSSAVDGVGDAANSAPVNGH